MKIYYSLESIKTVLRDIKPSKIALVSSNYLIKNCQWAISKIIKMSPIKIELIRIPNGEMAKDWEVLEKVLNEFIRAGLDRKSLTIALGGGSVTDLVGFASSIYQRGIRYINIPTTLLAQVDSSIGGKTAINFLGYKNQIGSFYNPVAVIIDSHFLETLKKEQIIDGFAEIIKAGLIKDPRILEIIKSHNLPELREKHIIEELISKSIKVKEYFIGKDSRDKSIRQILNFGHTVAHTLELKYGLSHGEAVLIGMIEELKIGEGLEETSPRVRSCLKELLKGLNITLDKKQLEIDWESILHDKKITGGEINLPVVKKTGEAKLIKVNLNKFIGRF